MEEMGINYELLAGLEEREKRGGLRWLCYIVRGDAGEGELKQRVKTWKPEIILEEIMIMKICSTLVWFCFEVKMLQ